MDDDCPAGDVAERRPTPPEAVRRTVRRDVVEDLPEQHALEMLEQWLWLFDEAHPTAGFGYPAVTVMAQALVGDRALEAFGVGEPVQVGAGEAEQVPQVVNGAKVRHRPWCRSHGGLEKENPLDRQDGPAPRTGEGAQEGRRGGQELGQFPGPVKGDVGEGGEWPGPGPSPIPAAGPPPSAPAGSQVPAKKAAARPLATEDMSAKGAAAGHDQPCRVCAEVRAADNTAACEEMPS